KKGTPENLIDSLLPGLSKSLRARSLHAHQPMRQRSHATPGGSKKAPLKTRLSILWPLLILLRGLAADLPDWENPAVTGLNNERPHATLVICPNPDTAKAIQFTANSERARSSFYRSLNGDWKYHYSTNQSGRVPDFWLPDFDDLK